MNQVEEKVKDEKLERKGDREGEKRKVSGVWRNKGRNQGGRRTEGERERKQKQLSPILLEALFLRLSSMCPLLLLLFLV